MASTEYNAWDEIERWFFDLWDVGQRTDKSILSYRRMVKAFEDFKELVKKQDFKEMQD